MSDCSREAWQAPRGIDGAVHWQGGTESELHYARFVNGEERKAECIELDGVKFVPERTCEVVGIRYEEAWDEFCIELSCGCHLWRDDDEPPRFCEVCGAKIRKVDECQTSR